MTNRPTCYNKAIDLLSRRPHFVAELRRKLEQRSYPEGEITATLARLTDLGFLDDEAAARGFVENRLRRRPLGRRRLAHELSRRGLARDLATAITSEIDDDQEHEAARQVAVSRHVRGVERPAIARHLDRKGFGKRVILEVLAELEEVEES